MADRVRVLIATTKGPVEVESIIDLEPGDGSIVALGSSANVLRDLLTPYRNFVARGSGVIARRFGHDAFRLELSDEIHTGESWQLGVVLAHALHKERRLAEAGERAERLLWVTGQVDYQLRVGTVGHIPEKLAGSVARLKAERAAGVEVHAIWPRADEGAVDQAWRARLTQLGITIHEVETAAGLPATIEPAAAAAPPASTVEPKELPAFTLDNVARRQLNIFFALDCSRSMAGEKVSSLNMAMRIAAQEVRKAARANAMIDMIVHVACFATGARWHAESVPAAAFEWTDVAADQADTDMGEALAMIGAVLPGLAARARQLAPAIILLSDGHPSDDFEAGLASLLAARAGEKAVRVAIAIGDDSDRATLAQFIGDAKIPPLQARDTDQLIERVRWVSGALLSQHSQGQVVAAPRPAAIPANADLVW